jgi:twitching motility protein PilI
MDLVKEDLKSFQARVAQRLRLANERGVAASWLAITVNGLNCLFPLSHTNEVLPFAPIIPVPYAMPWFMGIVSSRGRIYGVVNLKVYLMRGDHQVFPLTEIANGLPECSFIGFNAELNLNCVLLVNKVLGLRTLQDFAQCSSPANYSPDYLGSLYRDHDGIDWQEINLQNLSHSHEFLSISV